MLFRSDETQDIGIPALSMLRKLVPEQKNDLFLVGDGHQAIYNRKTVLSRAGINVRGRSRKLLLNYRTTRQIGQWASSYLANTIASDLDEGMDNLKGYRSILSGKAPLDFRSLVPEEKYRNVHEYLATLLPEQYSSTCIASPTKDSVLDWKHNLDTWGFPVLVLEKDDHASSAEPGLRITTIHRVKGLEFDRMIVALPHENLPRAKALGFVAATRAKRELVLC